MNLILKFAFYSVLIALIMQSSSLSCFAKFEMYLRLDGIPGDSAKERYAGWIEVRSYKHTMENASAFPGGGGGGGGAGRSTVGAFYFTKKVDKSTPLLSLSLLTGSRIRNAALDIVQSSGEGQDQVYVRFIFEDIIISSIESEGPADEWPGVETVGIKAARIRWESFTYDPVTGKPTGSVAKMWDVAGNREVRDYTPMPYPTEPSGRPTETPTASPYPTATSTPTPNYGTPPVLSIASGSVIVADHFYAVQDLTGLEDQDDPDQRELMIRWNAGSARTLDFYVYVQSDNGVWSYLGRTGGSNLKHLRWAPNAANLAEAFRNGPENGHEYRFKVLSVVSVADSNRFGIDGSWTGGDSVTFTTED